VGVLGWMVIGSTAGANSKAMPGGDEPSGLLGPRAVCVMAALAGGFLVTALGIGGIGSFFTIGAWLTALGGALLLLAIYRALTTASRSTRTAW
jgi:uncharacterized membrane protein YeaQ/YmgE (transglycosylase-associated protein family)